MTGGNSVISPKAQVSPQATVGPFGVIHDDVVVADGAVLGAGVILYPGTRIGRNVQVQDHAVIGKRPRSARGSTLGAQAAAAETRLADGVTIGTHAVIYAGCQLDQDVFIGDGASLRENCVVGRETIVGRGVLLEFGVRIGRQCLLFTGTYLSEEARVEDEVFIGAHVCTAAARVINFRRRLPTEVNSPLIRRGARVGTGAVLHPGVVVGEEAVVAAGAVVFEPVAPAVLVLGNPARVVRAVSRDEFLPDSPLLQQAPASGEGP